MEKEHPARLQIGDSVTTDMPTQEFNVTPTATLGDQQQMAEQSHTDSATQQYVMLP